MSDHVAQYIMEIAKEIADDIGVRLKDFSVRWGYSIEKGHAYVAGCSIETHPSGANGKKIEENYFERLMNAISGTNERWGIMFKEFVFDWEGEELKGCHYKWEKEEE